jgi:hypothetical protein
MTSKVFYDSIQIVIINFDVIKSLKTILPFVKFNLFI